MGWTFLLSGKAMTRGLNCSNRERKKTSRHMNVSCFRQYSCLFSPVRVLQQRTPDTDQIRFARIEQLLRIGNALDAAGQQDRNGNSPMRMGVSIIMVFSFQKSHKKRVSRLRSKSY